MVHQIKCIHCGKELPETEFYPSVLSRNYHICKKCHNKMTTKYSSAYQKRIRAKKKESNINPDKYLGGITIRILNHTKKGEYKYNLSNTSGHKMRTNNKKEFIRVITSFVGI